MRQRDPGAEAARLKKYREYMEQSRLMRKVLERMQSEGNSVMEDVSMCVLAPSISSFVLWVLKDALEKGTKRLYFLARDGYFMYRAASILCEEKGIPVECRYLYCSRYSLRVPMYHLDMEEAMEYICRGGMDVTLKKIFDRSGLTGEERKQVSEGLPLPFEEEEVIPYAKLGEVRKALEGSDCFQKYVYRHSREELPALEGYLRQEGFFEGVTDALVDSGWVGSMQKTVNRVLRHMGRDREIEGYYWGIYELPGGVKKEKYHCYYFSPGGHLREKVYFSNCLFEAVFSAPHGMTVGYEERDAEYHPRFSRMSRERAGFMEQTEEYLTVYVKEIAGYISDLSQIDCEEDKKVIKKLLRLFMGNPTKEEAEVYGALKFSDDVMDDAVRQVAEPLNEAELRANHAVNKILVMLGIKNGYIRESAWYEGSAARHGRNRRRHLFHYAVYKYLLYIRNTYFEGEKNV